MRRVLVVNNGSSTLKWALLDAADASSLAEGSHRSGARAEATEQLRAVLRGIGEFDAVGHRIVHGGGRFRETTRIDERVRADLESLVDIDPLHMRPALAAVDAIRAEAPTVPHFAVFDTAFHATMPEAAARYALPFEWTERWGLRRFGFHGLSVAHAVERARALTGGLPPRLVVCHLGGGSSVSAVHEGASVDTTMGFTPLEGLVMATRSGSVDPGLLLHLQRRHGVDAAELSDALTTRSGLLGVSGVSADLREVLAAADAGSPRASLAYAQFLLSLKRAVGAMTAVLGGLDAVVFTGGIGENEARVRRDLALALAFMGARLDEEANRSAAPDLDIAQRESSVRLLVIRAREDLVILREVLRLCSAAAGEKPPVS